MAKRTVFGGRSALGTSVTIRCGGVADGTRTRDNRNHNPGLYQLSYSHRWTAARVIQASTREIDSGLPDGNRTHNPQLRRLVLYPIELRAGAILISHLGHAGRGERIRTSDILVPNQARYQTALRPVRF